MTINNYVRYRFIEQIILDLYKDFSINNFPISIDKVINIINSLSNCKIMSFSEFIKINNCTKRDVVLICESNSGCTHYDKTNNRYLILYNDFTDNNNVTGRILWTLCHELGHIKAGHLPMISNLASQIAENGFNNLSNPVLESETDYFTATFLSPFQLFKFLNVQYPKDVQNTFGLSSQASNYRWENYLKWKDYRIKTAFDSKILKIYMSN